MAHLKKLKKNLTCCNQHIGSLVRIPNFGLYYTQTNELGRES